MGISSHHLAWDTTLCDLPYTYTLPAQLKTATSLITAERTGFLLRPGHRHSARSLIYARVLVWHISTYPVASLPVWMSNPQQLCAIGRYLFCPSADGISRIDIASDGSADIKTFATASSLVGATLCACHKTLYAVFGNRLAEVR